jgi:hypothetical protein
MGLFLLCLFVSPALDASAAVKLMPEASASRTSSPPPGAAPVLFRLYVEFQIAPPATVWRAIQEEVNSIMSPIGWRIHWNYLLGDVKRHLSLELAVMRFKGRCDVDSLPAESKPSAALGATSVTDGTVSPFGSVNCDAVRNFVAPLLSLQQGVRREATFGRALGRVLAHELFHILTASQLHASKGLGRAGFTPDELMQESFRFSKSDVQRLRIRLLPLVLRSSDWIGSPERGRGLSLFVLSGCAGCHGTRAEGTPWGPALLPVSSRFDAVDLATRLRDHSSAIRRYAPRLRIPWHRMNIAELQAVSRYLNGLTEKQERGADRQRTESVRPAAFPTPNN